MTPWTTDVIARLGTVPDRVIAHQLGRSQARVCEKRTELGIPPYRPHTSWTPERVALLGTAPDGDVARLLGTSVDAGQMARSVRGIPPAISQGWPTRPIDWTPERVALLGVASDAEVARRIGVGRSSVRDERVRRGIPPATMRWSTARKRPEREVARARSTSDPVHRAILEDPDLGEVPDAVIAERVGCSRQVVGKLRRRACVESVGLHVGRAMRLQDLREYLRRRREPAELHAWSTERRGSERQLQRDLASLGAVYRRDLDLYELPRRAAPDTSTTASL